MATQSQSIPLSVSRPLEGYPPRNYSFDLASALLAGWFMLGLYLDGWAHSNGRVDNTFFTPWHGVLYSGLAACALLLVVYQYRNMRLGYRWEKALPKGYGLSRLGVVVFFLAGAGDFVWHSIFGFEKSVELLLSPTHLALATGAFLFMTGALRSGLSYPSDRTGWRGLLPVVLVVFFVFCLLTFFTQYANFFNNASFITMDNFNQIVDLRTYQATAAMGMLLQAGVMMGVIVFAVRHWKLPVGALTLMLTLNAALMWVMGYDDQQKYWYVIFAALVTGIVADVLLITLKPDEQGNASIVNFRIFAFVVPVILFLLLNVLILVTVGTWLSIHLWLGVSFMTGVVGLFLSYFIVPPQITQELS